MSSVEEMQAVRATPAQAIATLLDVSRMREWHAPDVTITAARRAGQLVPGDRFRVEAIAGPRFEYQVEAITDREVVLRFEGTWCGEERWSFLADGDDTVVRRTYSVEDFGGLAGVAWRILGPPLVLAHFKLELARFRSVVERLPRVRGEIGPRDREAGGESADSQREPGSDAPPQRRFTIDEG